MSYKTTYFVRSPKGFYFRVLGYGVAFDRDLPELFSERVGARKVLRIHRWSFQLLSRRGLCL